MNEYESAHLGLLRPLLAECAVLLKSNGAFPLQEAGRIAAYGNGVRHTLKGGTGSGEVNSRFFITVEQGLTDAGFTVTTEDWLRRYDEIRAKTAADFYGALRKKVLLRPSAFTQTMMGTVIPEPEYYLPLSGEGDAAIYVLSRSCGEGSDRRAVKGDAYLTDTEIRDIRELNRKYRKFMLILNVGAPVDLTPVNTVGNILVLSQLGVETGAVVADLLLGRAYPSGKLTTTWASLKDYCPVGDFAESEDTCYREGIYVGYRWFDSVGKKPLYPFGHGLGYSTFRMEHPVMHHDAGTLTVSAKIINTGHFAGKEVAQVYVSKPQGKLDQPAQALVGWKKTPELKPGETAELEITFTLRDIASFDGERCAWILEAGSYLFRIGFSSADNGPFAVLRLDGPVIFEECSPVFGSSGFEDWKPALPEIPIPAGIPEICLSVSDFIYAEDTDSVPVEELQTELFEKLSDEELALLNVGAYNSRSGPSGVIGESSLHVCGAAGETCNLFEKFGIPILPMADGPAGIRISKQYYTDKKGDHPIGSTLPESISVLLPSVVSKLTAGKKPAGAELREQYCTAIPIGTAIAQSWNEELAALCGDIVGEEMTLFHVPLWLAPALNIHRNVLCGRNFEYYSEDPLISGKIAAAITRGVQKHPGCGVTVKHFAANNQETNRYNNCSHVSERAMREIYAKGFEICVKDAQPHAVMTSYNLINGIHTSESRPMTETLLREEFGFRGMVMTDWVIASFLLSRGAKYPAPDPAKVAAAGCSAFMPGSEGDKKAILEGLKAGTVTREQLIKNAAYTARVAHALRG